MKKPIKKKKEKTPPLPVEEIANENNCTYRLTMKFNEEIFDCFTNDLKIGILSFKPTNVLTEGYIKIKKGDSVFERKFPLVKMKQLFADEQTLEIFLANILL